MTGVLPVDKPEGFTSFDVVAKLRGLSKTKKIGHSGTLDPMATGVLPLFLDSATKACAVLPEEDKRYEAGIRFGLTTDTQDITGKVIEQKESHVTEEQFRTVMETFVGEQLQLPPMYSAVKVGGRPLYKTARSGGEVPREAKKIIVYSIGLLAFSEADQTARIDVCCGRGTYIRTLIADMGEQLGCGAVMNSLRRTEACGFTLEDCYTLPEIGKLASEGELEAALLPMERVFISLPELILNDRDAGLYCNGVPLDLGKRGWEPMEGDVAVKDGDGRLLGISVMDAETGQLRLRKMFFER